MTKNLPPRPTRRRLLLGAGALLALPAVLGRRAFAVTPDEIRRRGKLLVGIQGDNPPWGFVNASGRQEGFDADIAELFGRDLGVPVEFTPLAVANRIPALTTGRVDVLFATMAMLPERARAVQYSKPYVANVNYVVAPRSAEIRSYADLGRYVIGVPRASTMDQLITRHAPAGTTIRRFDDDAATIQALLSGQVQAVGGNMFYAQRLNEARPDSVENKFELTRLYNGACTRLGEREINAAINGFIDRIKSNGELTRVYRKWMHTDPPEFPTQVEGVPFVVN